MERKLAIKRFIDLELYGIAKLREIAYFCRIASEGKKVEFI